MVLCQIGSCTSLLFPPGYTIVQFCCSETWLNIFRCHHWLVRVTESLWVIPTLLNPTQPEEDVNVLNFPCSLTNFRWFSPSACCLQSAMPPLVIKNGFDLQRSHQTFCGSPATGKIQSKVSSTPSSLVTTVSFQFALYLVVVFLAICFLKLSIKEKLIRLDYD